MPARAAADADSDRAQAKVLERVEASARVVEEMMAEISRELFLNAAVSHVTESDQPEGSTTAVVGAAVERHLNQLDSTFLGTLDGYIQGCSEKGATDVAEVLLLVRDEVLRRLGQRLPPEMQLLDAAMAASGPQARMELLKKYALLSTQQLEAAQKLQQEQGAEEKVQQQQEQGREEEQQDTDSAAVDVDTAGSEAAGSGGARGPEGSASGGASASASGGDVGEPDGGTAGGGSMHCLASDLMRAASQLIRDMELMPEVPDRRLLARLVLVREELQQMLLEAEFMQGSGSTTGSATHSTAGGGEGGGGSGAEDAAAAAAFLQPFQQLGAVPKSCAVFLQRLMAMPGSQERQALLRHALSKDTERLPGAGQPGPNATQREKLRAAAEAPQDWVRPGRFIQSLNAMQAELLEQAAGRGGSADGGEAPPLPPPPTSDAVLEQLESVRRETLGVLMDLAGEGGQAEEEPFLP